MIDSRLVFIKEEKDYAHVDSMTAAEVKGIKMHRKSKEMKVQRNYTKEDTDFGERYKCEECGRINKSIYALKYHKESVHEGKMYTCTKCSKKFTQKSNLRTHMKTMHDGDRRFACHLCDYKAGQKGNLVTHMKTKHTSR